MAERVIRILLIEDNQGDALLVKEYFKEYDKGIIELDWVDMLAAGIEKLEDNEYDLIMTDLSLPDSIPDETVSRIVEVSRDIPVAVLSTYSADVIRNKVKEDGAFEYLNKDDLCSEKLADLFNKIFEGETI